MRRRAFLKAMCAAGGAAVLPAAGAATAARPLKVCVFADLHFSVNRFANGTPAFLEKILARAQETSCDMVIHLGDMIQDLSKKPVQDLVRRYNDFAIPAYHVIGNHDQDGTSHEETLAAFRLEKGYYAFDRGGFRFVVLDPNYFCNEPGVFIHHSRGNYFRRLPGSTIDWIPPDQLDWLKATLDASPFPCIVLSHQSFERKGGVCNGRAVRAIFEAANAKNPGRVRLVINGHYHVDNLRIINNIAYWDVNSANHYWWGGVQTKYPEAYVAQHRLVTRTLAWKDPLSAILTLHPDGRIQAEGSSSSWLFGVTPKMAGFTEYDGNGRRIEPVIRSFDITVHA